MTARRAAPPSTRPPKPDRKSPKAPTPEALLAALAERERELAEALEQQSASAEVLGAISKSVADAAPVFEAIIDACQRLFGSEEIGVYTIGDDDMVRVAAWRGPRADEVRNDVTPVGESVTGRLIRERRMHHIPDLAAEPGISATVRERAERLGSASLLYAPMLSEDRGLGSILVVRSPPRPFTDREQALLQTFADQAAIAIHNAGLFRETKEALERQTATAEILRVISQSPTDARPVFERIVLTAVRVLKCDLAGMLLRDGDSFVHAASANSQGLLEIFDPPFRTKIDPSANFPSRVLVDKAMLHFRDLSEIDLPPHERVVQEQLQAQSGLYLPLVREDECIGVLLVMGRRPNSFSPKDIAQAESFRDQAMIAIENARLFNEVQAKTRDLEESLAQQTATADVLKVISRSAFDLQAVFDTLISSAVELSGANRGAIYLRDGEVFRWLAASGADSDYVEYMRSHPRTVGRSSVVGRVALSGRVECIADMLEDKEFELPLSVLARGRGVLGVPLLRDGKVEGAIVLTRYAPGVYSQRQVDLVQTFADQAVIAIENVRLFDEVQAKTRDLEEALRFQTATSEVLKAISRSPNSLAPVLEVIAGTSRALCGARESAIFMFDDRNYRLVAESGLQASFREFLHANPIALETRGSSTARAAREKQTVHIPNIAHDPEYGVGPMARGSPRALLSVPLMRNGEAVGVITLLQPDVTPFSARQIEAVETFADQAIIAIENTRLFEEVQARTRDLTEALQMQTATSDVLKVISRSAFDLQAVFNTLVSSAVELSGALTGTICVRDGDVYRYRDTVGAEHTSALAQYLREHPAVPGRATIAGRVLLSGKVERIPDCLADPDYVVPMGSLASNVRSLLGVPLLRKDGVEGAIILTRDEPGHFSDRQVEIVQTFADQAVIALENVRLFDEVQARTKELAASLDDLRKAQDRLVQSEKLASLGQLTAGIAHEIKNPLNFINNFSALSRELMDELREVLAKAPVDAADRGEADELIGMIDANLDKVVSHGKRADSIVKNMLLHSREGSGERTRVNVNAMVEEALNLAYHGARAERPGFNVTIAKSLDENAGAAEIYAQEMTRVLLNLISNGFYATNKRKQGEATGAYEPTITASTRDLGHSVEIAIRDNGTGIPDEVKAKMFNPFFTTKPAGEGTGLGLSLSHDIVAKQHGGTIEVTTEPGAFTQFTLILPRAGIAS